MSLSTIYRGDRKRQGNRKKAKKETQKMAAFVGALGSGGEECSISASRAFWRSGRNLIFRDF